jgi:RNA-binding protein
MAMTLSNSQKRHLRGLCHDLKPVVTVADRGLVDTVLAEIEQALDHHELIKVKLRAERDQRQQWSDAIIATTGATLVQAIGQVNCFYRPRRSDPKLTLPA